MIINLHSPTGGIGCTTIATALASELSHLAPTMLYETQADVRRILGVRSREPNDQFPIPPRTRALGASPPPPLTLHLNSSDSYPEDEQALAALTGGQRIRHTVIDYGTTLPADFGVNVAIVANDFLSLSTYSELLTSGHRDRFVIYRENPSRALNRSDVSAILPEHPIATIPTDLDLARVLDAGLLLTKRPSAIYLPIDQLISALSKEHE